ncbi:CLN3 domain containing protein, partial [Asbolus verrucosus]
MTEYQSSDVILPAENKKLTTKKKPWRALISYWILGLCNNYGYVVMLTAASDIIGENECEGYPLHTFFFSRIYFSSL